MIKDKIKIAVVNFSTVWGDKEANLKQIIKYCEEAGENNVNLILFPETCLTGYDNDKEQVRSKKMHVKLAETIPGKSTEQISELAKKYKMHVIFGMSERKSNRSKKIYNSAAIIYPDGRAESYRKIHLPFDEAEWAIEGNEPKLIETEWGKIGIEICYDTYCFPELLRYYRAKGARLILNVTACPDAPCTFGAAKLTLPAYAYINYVYIASANLCGTDLYNHFSGGSCIVGPDKSKGDYNVYLGKMFGEEGSNKEGIIIGEIDLSLADKYTDIPIYKGDWNSKLYKKLYSEF